MLHRTRAAVRARLSSAKASSSTIRRGTSTCARRAKSCAGPARAVRAYGTGQIPLRAGIARSRRGARRARGRAASTATPTKSMWSGCGYRHTEPYKKAMRKRKVWIEPLFAEAKEWHGMRRFRRRRLEKVNIEALLIASGQNAKRLLAFGGRRPKKLAQAAALRPPTDTDHDTGSAREHRSRCSWRSTKAFFNSLGGFWYISGTYSLDADSPLCEEPGAH